MAIDYSQLEERKNHFFRDSYRKLLNLLVLLLWVGLVMATVLTFMVLTPGTPKYYASTTTGELYNLNSLGEPVVTNDYILKWASLLASQVYNLNFERYQSELNLVKPKFTENGWTALQSAFKATGFLNSIEQNKLISTAVVDGAPVISFHGIIHHRFTWVVEFPLLVTFQSASAKRQQRLNVKVRIMRVPVLDVPQGIQCDGFVAQTPL